MSLLTYMAKKQTSPGLTLQTAPGMSARVLIVDDDPNIQSLISDCLASENIPCVTASSAEEAITILQKENISLILLDWCLRGGMDTSGAEVLRASKRLHPLLPVIVQSGMAFDVRTDAVVQHADGFLQKPFNCTLINSYVAQWLKRLQATPAVFLPQCDHDISPLRHFQCVYIRHVLQLVEGNVSVAATRLGVHRHTVAAALKEAEARS